MGVPRMFVKGRVVSPCRGCTERKEYCHGKCERYAAYKASATADYEARRDAYRGERMMETYTISNCVRSKELRKTGGKV